VIPDAAIDLLRPTVQVFDRRLAYLLPNRLIAGWGFPWARLVLRRRHPVIIGVTGSAGKTTTTETIGRVLGHPAAQRVVGQVRVARNNMNNYVGLPLVVLGYERFVKKGRDRLKFLLTAPWRALSAALGGRYPSVLVLEFGTSESGYLQALVDLAPPDVSVVTTIGPAHLEGLGSELGVAREKATLVRGTRRGGLALVGTGHDFLEELERNSPVPVIRVPGRGPDLSQNIARLVARRFRIPDDAIEEALAGVSPVERRLNTMNVGGIVVIDDTFNANPVSMRLGLDTLGQGPATGGRRVAVLGEMLELGEEAIRYHEDIGRHARRVAQLVIGVGALARHYGPDIWYADSHACASEISGLVTNGDRVFVKGSGAVAMRRVVERLRETRGLPGKSVE